MFQKQTKSGSFEALSKIFYSFKDRGSLNALLNLSKEEKSRGVITVSAGNHAQGLAHQGLTLNIAVTVIMPVQTPLVKVRERRIAKKLLLQVYPSVYPKKLLLHGYTSVSQDSVRR